MAAAVKPKARSRAPHTSRAMPRKARDTKTGERSVDAPYRAISGGATSPPPALPVSYWLERSSRVIIWIIGIAIILELFGIQIGPLVAGLGLF